MKTSLVVCCFMMSYVCFGYLGDFYEETNVHRFWWNLPPFSSSNVSGAKNEDRIAKQKGTHSQEQPGSDWPNA